MKPKLFIAAAFGSLLLAIPISAALNHYHNQVKSEQKQNHNLQLKFDGLQKNLNLQKNSADQLQKQNEDLQKKNSDLNSQLQSKIDAKNKLASAQRAQAQTAPVSLSGGGNCEAYRGLISQYGWNVNTAMAVMHAESGCNPNASSPTCDHGLMQVNCVHAGMVGGDLSLLNDPATNIRVAFAVYQGQGWAGWTTYTSGAYLRYL